MPKISTSTKTTYDYSSGPLFNILESQRRYGEFQERCPGRPTAEERLNVVSYLAKYDISHETEISPFDWVDTQWDVIVELDAKTQKAEKSTRVLQRELIARACAFGSRVQADKPFREAFCALPVWADCGRCKPEPDGNMIEFTVRHVSGTGVNGRKRGSDRWKGLAMLGDLGCDWAVWFDAIAKAGGPAGLAKKARAAQAEERRRVRDASAARDGEAPSVEGSAVPSKAVSSAKKTSPVTRSSGGGKGTGGKTTGKASRKADAPRKRKKGSARDRSVQNEGPIELMARLIMPPGVLSAIQAMPHNVSGTFSFTRVQTIGNEVHMDVVSIDHH